MEGQTVAVVGPAVSFFACPFRGFYVIRAKDGIVQGVVAALPLNEESVPRLWIWPFQTVQVVSFFQVVLLR